MLSLMARETVNIQDDVQKKAHQEKVFTLASDDP